MKESSRSVANRQPATKETKTNQKKRTLKEVASTMLMALAEKAQEERRRPLRAKQQEQEDEIADMTFGPNWRDNPPEPAPKLSLVPKLNSDSD